MLRMLVMIALIGVSGCGSQQPAKKIQPAAAEVQTLDEVNDYRSRSLKRRDTLASLFDKYDNLAPAITLSNRIRANKEVIEGKLAAEKWFAEELDMTPEQLVAKYGDLKGLDLVEASNKEVEAFKAQRK